MPAKIKRKTAEKCAVHQSVREECVKALVGYENENGDWRTGRGYFRKQAVLERLNYSDAIADFLRWDYIIEGIEDEHGIDVIGVAERFFRKQEEYDENGDKITLPTHPNHYRAGGNGRRTVGYASVQYQNGHFLVAARNEQRAETAKTLLDLNSESKLRLAARA